VAISALTTTADGGPYLQSIPATGNGYTIGVTGNAPNESVTVAIGTGTATIYTGSAQCVGA
jgi:hypothetical protein